MVFFSKNVRISQIKNVDKNVFDSIIVMRSGETKLGKEEFHGSGKTDGKKDKNSKLMSLRRDDDKLFGKYKTIWTKIEGLKKY